MLRANKTVRRATWLTGLAVAAALAVAGCSSSGSSASGASSQSSGAQSSTSANSDAAMENPNLDLGSSVGDKPAPGLTLVNQFGQQMSLSQFRGKVVMLSFEDSECTTVCPLTTQSMVLAKELLGKAGTSVQLLGVDANPDAIKVADVMDYSRVHGMINQWDSLTQMAYSSVTQSAQVLATEVASLLPSHPKLKSLESLGTIPAQTPAATVSLPAAGGTAPATAGTVTLGPGQARLVVFFATWLTETSDLNSELASLNSYAKAAAGKRLPALTVVDETVTEPSAAAVTSYLHPLRP